MPIASDRAGSVDANILAAPGPQPTTLAINDLIDAYRKGVVTSQDLIERGIQIPVQAAKAKQDIADLREIRPLARQAQVGALSGEIEIQPRKQKLQTEQVEQAITALPTPEEAQATSAERLKSAQIRNALVSSDSKVRLNAISQLTNDKVLDLWSAANGQPPPDHLEIPGGGVSEPKPIDEFYLEQFGQHPAGTVPRDNLNRPEVQAAYQKYVQEAKNRPESVFKGDPRYNQILRKELQNLDLTTAIKHAQITALPKVLEEQAKAAAEAPSKAAAQALPLQREYGTRQEIQDLRKVQAAYYKLQNLLDPNSPPSAAKDQGAIFSWMKILDPGSTVREGEYATAKNARGVPETIRNFWNQTLTGQILTKEQRESFRSAVEPVYLGQVKSAEPTIRQFLSQEEKIGATGDVVPQEDAKLLERLKPGSPPIALPGQSNQQPQVGDIFKLPDGRKIKIKAITATGVIPDESYPP